MAGAPSIMTGIRQVIAVDPLTGLPSDDSSAGRVYAAGFSAVALLVACDIFEVQVPAGKRAAIRGIFLNQFSDFGDANAEILGVTIIRGLAVLGGGGQVLVLQPVKLANVVAPSLVVNAFRSPVASGGTPATLFADGWNVAAGWIHAPPKAERIEIAGGTIGVVRVTVPADSLTTNGTLIVEEMDA